MDNSKLKPCPFCGQSVELHEARTGRRRYYQIYCMTEGCPCYMTYTAYDTEEEATKMWNERMGS